MSYKAITICLTTTLTMAYVGLVFLYGAAVAGDLESEKVVSHGRNVAGRVSSQNIEVSQPNQGYSMILEKRALEDQLIEAKLMLNLINNSQQTSK